MPKAPKADPALQSEAPNDDKAGTWEEDQDRRGYYYDDAHGYRIFRPDEADESEPDDMEECNEKTPGHVHDPV